MADTFIDHVKPANMLPAKLTSNSDYIVSRRYRTFNPEVGGSYSYSSNNTFRITLNSASEFLAGADSYLEFKLSMNAVDAGLHASQLTQRYLDHCGHSLFSSLKIQLSNGTVLEQIDGYNKLYSIFSNWTISQNHRDNVEGPYSCDSSNKYQIIDSESRSTVQNITGTAIIYDNVGDPDGDRMLIITDGRALSEVQVGDWILLANNQRSQVERVVSNTKVQLATSLGADRDDAACRPALILKNNAHFTPRARAANSNVVSVMVRIKPFSNLLQNQKLLPLFYLKNLQLVFTLERPEFCMTLIPTATANTVFSYTISDVKYQACLVQPSDEILEDYRQLYNSEDQPIEIPYASYQHNMRYQQNVPTGTLSFTIPASVRSAKAVISAFYSVYSETISTATNFTVNVDSVSQTIKNGCASYVYKIGSEQYPSFDRADTSGVFNGEMLAWGLLGLGVHGNTLQDVSFKPNEFFPVNRVKRQIGGAANAVDVLDSTKALFVAQLSRSDNQYTGADLLSNDIIADFTFEQLSDATGALVNPSDMYIRTWICHDRILTIHRSGIICKY